MSSTKSFIFVGGLAVGLIFGYLISQVPRHRASHDGAKSAASGSEDRPTVLNEAGNPFKTQTSAALRESAVDEEGEQSLNERALAKLYPASVGLRILKDIRIMTALSTNDVASAKRLLVLDLDGNVSSLSGLTREVEISEFDRKALAQGQHFLNQIKDEDQSRR